MGLGFNGICGPGHTSRDLGVGLGLFHLRRLGLGQILLGQSRDRNLWDIQIPSKFGTSWDSSPTGQKSLGQSRDYELWDSSPWDKYPWDWQARPIPIPAFIPKI